MLHNQVVLQYKVLFFFIFLIFSSPFQAQAQKQDTSEEEIMEFHPSISVSESYNDNIRQEDYKEGDFSIQCRPGLQLKYNGDRHRHVLEYFSSFTRYHHLHEEDTNTHNAALTNTLKLGKIIEFTVETTDTFSSERRDLRLAERKDNYLETNVFTVKPSLQINVLERTFLKGSYQYSRTSILEEDSEDYLSNTFSGSLHQQISDDLQLFGGYRYTEQDFLENSPDLIDRSIFSGLNWNITSSLRLKGEYSFNWREYARKTGLVTEKGTETDIWKVTLLNDIDESTHVNISYSQSQIVREISDTEQVLARTFSLVLNRVVGELFIINLSGNYSEDVFQFSERKDITSDINLLLSSNFSKIILFRVGGGYGNNYFWPIAIREDVYTGQAGITYRPQEWLSASIDYRHTETDHNASKENEEFRPEYIQNIVTATISARF